ncbi:hypothetical protein CA54_00670 [Symmachiella macrocystis]|uniref:Uncharacterized protein n=1 Tax=Symmachiella macrocystis TaxID=2527985 RepID=A0A5C6BHR5_9PLAN|nr:hypothetical protein CA54_00670 [Symmachiella macrocystis]
MGKIKQGAKSPDCGFKRGIAWYSLELCPQSMHDARLGFTHRVGFHPQFLGCSLAGPAFDGRQLKRFPGCRLEFIFDQIQASRYKSAQLSGDLGFIEFGRFYCRKFLCCSGKDELMEEAQIWALGDVIKKQPSLSEFMNVTVGTRLVRSSDSSPWNVQVLNTVVS